MHAMPEIGTTLREARMRARIDVSEIEEQTKIRAKYLRALENEEWGLLPGPAYAKSFLRAYAQALGVDDRALVEEYNARYERPNESERPEPPREHLRQSPRRQGPSGMPRAPSRWLIGAAVAAVVVIALALIGALSGSPSKPAARHGAAHRSAAVKVHGNTAPPPGKAPAAGAGMVTLSLQPTARVWVCLLGDQQRKLIPGVTLVPEEGVRHTYRAKAFTVNLGDNHVVLLVNGKRQEVPASAQPIGYSISASGLTPLAAGHLPTCA